MAEITKRRSGELVRGVFKILLKHPDGLPAKEVLRQLADIVPPTPFEASMYPNRPNVRRYEKIVRFSTINTVKAGWLLKDKGSWSLTDEGRAAFEKFSDAEDFHRAARKLYRKWKADQPAGENYDEEVDAGEAATTLEEAAESAWSQIENFLEGMSPYDFQELVAGLLRGMGYYVDWISPPGPGQRHRYCGSYRPTRCKRPPNQGAGQAESRQNSGGWCPRIHGSAWRLRCWTLCVYRRIHTRRRRRGTASREAAYYVIGSQEIV